MYYLPGVIVKIQKDSHRCVRKIYNLPKCLPLGWAIIVEARDFNTAGAAGDTASSIATEPVAWLRSRAVFSSLAVRC
jgi:hypothetical protein